MGDKDGAVMEDDGEDDGQVPNLRVRQPISTRTA